MLHLGICLCHKLTISPSFRHNTMEFSVFLITNYQTLPQTVTLKWTSELAKLELDKGRFVYMGLLSTVDSICVPSGTANKRE